MWYGGNSYAQCTPFLTPEHKNTASEFPTRRLVLLRKVCVCGVERRASVTKLNSFKWSLFTLVVSLRCQAFRKSSYDHICSKTTHTNTLFVQFFVKKNRKNRLSANTTRGSIPNIISYWYRVEENFMGFPTKKTACKSEQNSLQAWPICQGMYVHRCAFLPIMANFGGTFTMNLYHFATVDVKYWWVLKIMTKHF